MSQKFKNPIEVEGYVLSNDGALSGEYRIGTPGTKIAGSALMAYMQFYTGGTEKMRVDINGNVGIGTSSPGQKLEVNGNIKLSSTAGSTATPSYINLGLDYSNGTTKDKLKVYLYNSGGEQYGFTVGSVSDVQYHSNAIHDFYLNNSAAVRINSTGLGIGTTTPSAKLDVNGRALVNEFQYTKAINISGANLNDYTFAGFYNGEGMVNAPNSGWFWVTVERYSGDGNWAHQTATTFGSGNTANEVYTRTKSGGTWTNWKRLIDWGDVNGTTNYVSKFTGNNSLGNSSIFDNGSAVGIFTSAPGFATPGRGVLSLNGSSNSLMEFQAGGAFKSYLYQNGTSFEIYDKNAILFSVSVSERMRITSGGNVGIGTTSPQGKLSVDGGNIRFNYGNDAAAYYLYLNHNSSQDGGMLWTRDNSTFDWQINNLGYNGDLSFYSYGTGSPALVLQRASGNIGIGTTSPSEKLVVGNLGGGVKRIYVPGTYNFDGSYLSNYDGNGGGKLELVAHTGVSNSASWRIANNNDTYGQSLTFSYAPNTTSYSGLSYSAPAMLIANTGNVGIGTTSPDSTLTINGSGSSQIRLRSNEGNRGFLYVDGTEFALGTSTSIPLNIQTNGSTKMTVTSGGNVGIGTTTPYSKLDVVDYTSYLSLTSSINSEATTPDQQIGGIDLRKHYGLAIGASIRQLQADGIYNYSQSHLAFYTNDGSVAFGSVPPERMRITDTGNVGIGRTSPNNKLEVGGSIVSTGGGTFGLGGTFGFGSSQTSITGDALMAYVAINTGGSGEKMRVDINGNVGIGTTTPGAKLDVNGDALINGLTVGRGGGNSAYNTAFGVGALSSNTSGEYNIAIGRSANNAVNISGSTVIGTDLFTSPGNSSLTSNCLVIGQYNPSNSGTQFPHIYAPDKINCPNGNTITDVLAVDYSVYTAVFMEYSIFNSTGDQFRAGTYTVAFKSTGTQVDKDDQTVVYSGTTLAATFTIGGSGSVAIIQLRNQDSDTYDIRVTARLLMR